MVTADGTVVLVLPLDHLETVGCSVPCDMNSDWPRNTCCNQASAMITKRHVGKPACVAMPKLPMIQTWVGHFLLAVQRTTIQPPHQTNGNPGELLWQNSLSECTNNECVMMQCTQRLMTCILNMLSTKACPCMFNVARHRVWFLQSQICE